MSATKPVYLTQEALDRLQDELLFMRTKERARIAEAIAEARAQGDLSENAEFDAAKEEQGKLEARIAKAAAVIANARVVDESKVDNSKAFILSRVEVKNVTKGGVHTFTLVSGEEADPANGKISVTSPIGKGLLGKSVGDSVEIDVPAGKVRFEITAISRL